jgi:hypothetical protein
VTVVDDTAVPGLLAAGPVVVLTGPAARAAADALLIAIRSRRVNGLPRSAHYDAIAAALVSAAGQSDGRKTTAAQHERMEINPPTVPVPDAARDLGLSVRQTRRLAPKLGGRIVGGRWLLDAQAVAEHVNGGSQ